jgi:DNA-binding transcriptional LysR family regulator
MNKPPIPLPPIQSLKALEALDRLESATDVARELNLTQSAVSRQLKTLEEHLGTPIFLRDRRALRLTPQARDFAAIVRESLEKLTQAALTLRLQPSGGTLSLAILPSFGMRWLVPRLPEFATRHPDVTVNLTTRLHPFSFQSETFDAAIHFGKPETWPGTEALPLLTETGRPLASPDLLPKGPVTAHALGKLPLLHIQSRPNAWRNWFAVQGVDTQLPTGAYFDQFTALMQAVHHGLGIAILPDFLTESERAAGKLVEACAAPPMTLGTYHLVWPTGPISPALTAFRDWLALIAEEENLPR